MTAKEEYEYTSVAGTDSTAEYNVQNDEINIQSTKMSSESAVPTDRKFLYIAACVGT
jgi:hypothetical protein